MRKSAIVLVLSLATAGLVSAQTGPLNNQQASPQSQQGTYSAWGPGAQLQAKSLEGKLAFANNLPTLVAKDGTYLLDMPEFFYYAYTDGIKAGDTVKADGYLLPTVPGQDKPGFIVTKAVVNGKTYDFTAGYGRGMMGGHGGMMGGYGRMMGGYGQNGAGPMMGGRRGGRW